MGASRVQCEAVDGYAVDRQDLHQYGCAGIVAAERQLVGTAGGGIQDAPDVTLGLDVDGGKDLAVDGVEPGGSGIVGVRAVDAGAVADRCGRGLVGAAAQARILLGLQRVVGHYLHVLQDDVANRAGSDLRGACLVAAHAFGGADRYDPGQPGGHLVQRDAMHMRVEPVKAGRMIGRYLNRVIHRAGCHVHIGMAGGVGSVAGCRRRCGSSWVGGIEQLKKYIVAVGVAWPLGTMRLDDQSVRMQVGRVADQGGIIGHMLGIECRWQVVHQADFQRITGGQLQVNAAQGVSTSSGAHVLPR